MSEVKQIRPNYVILANRIGLFTAEIVLSVCAFDLRSSC